MRWEKMFFLFRSISVMQQWFMSNLGVKVLYFSNFGVPFFSPMRGCAEYIPHSFFSCGLLLLLSHFIQGQEREGGEEGLEMAR